MIFDESTLQKLNRLTLVASQVHAGIMKGERRSTKRGASIEFADYRDYVAGDDLRRLDWNIYGRLDRPFIKLLEEEEDLAIHILVDASKSMDWGEGENHKFHYALRLAAALGAIALNAGDRLSTAILKTGDSPRSQSPFFGPARGQQSLMRYMAFLEKIRPAGVTELNQTLREYALAAQRPGLAFLISDLFVPGGCQAGLSQLQSQGYEVVLIHLLSPDELEPPYAGDLRLVDIETGQAREVSLDSGLRELYRQRLEAWREEILNYCHKRRVRYLGLSTAEPWDKFVLYELRRAGVAK